MAVVTFDGVGKIYPDGTRALSDFSLEIGDGEFMVFVGPSGCGKTTALRMLAGLEEITEGEVRIDGKTINTLDPRKRDVAMVFQNYALYPHMTIYQNIAFPLENAGMKKDEIRRRVEQTAKLLDLGDMLKRRPRALSGGQRQRVAMGRAIVREPSVFLMDEPLSNLDAKLRVQMRAEITSLQRSLGVTTVYVTHDQTEAMTMGNRIVVLRKGELQQVGPPQELYDSPTNLFVASFVGSPAMNLFEGRLERDETSGSVVCVIGEQRLLIGDELLRERPALGELLGRTVAVGIRPEHLPCVDGAYSGPTLAAQVVNVEALGFERFVHAEIAAQPVMTDAIIEIAEDTDAAILQTLEHEAGSRRTPVVSRVSGDIRVAIGEPVRLQVDHRHLHFFEIATGLTL